MIAALLGAVLADVLGTVSGVLGSIAISGGVVIFAFIIIFTITTQTSLKRQLHIHHILPYSSTMQFRA